MALYIVFENGNEITRHIGSDPDFDLRNKAKDIKHIQADGHELEHIKNKFTHIPLAPGERVVRWYGDTAKFIVGNL